MQSLPDSLAWAHPIVAEWFVRKFGTPTEPQEQGWPHSLAGRTTLISAPTGSGKTLAAFLACIDKLVRKALCLYYAALAPETPAWAKAVMLGALGYFILPLDLIPDAIPVIGYADDLGVILAAAATVAVKVTLSRNVLGFVEAARVTVVPPTSKMLGSEVLGRKFALSPLYCAVREWLPILTPTPA